VQRIQAAQLRLVATHVRETPISLIGNILKEPILKRENTRSYNQEYAYECVYRFKRFG
jgi:hypothetical protein